MTEYRLLTIWRIKAPLTKVYEAIQNSLNWPQWWPGSRKVEQTAAGDRHGINNIRNYAWQGEFPYLLEFSMRATRIERLVAIEGAAEGDLEGVGRWQFSRQGAVSIVRYEWHVHSTLAWMNLIAPIARSMFIHNHVLVMEQGGEGLARLLGAPLLSQQNIDLMAAAASSATPGDGPADPGEQSRRAG